MKKPQLESFITQGVEKHKASRIETPPPQTHSSDINKDTVLTRLEEVYSRALTDGSYPSALKSLELILKILLLKDSTPLTPSISDLDKQAIQKLIEELKLE